MVRNQQLPYTLHDYGGLTDFFLKGNLFHSDQHLSWSLYFLTEFDEPVIHARFLCSSDTTEYQRVSDVQVGEGGR